MTNNFLISSAKFKGVGPKTLEKLHQLNLHTIDDLVFHLPTRYQDKTHIIPIAKARPGMQALVEGKIETIKMTNHYHPQLLCYIRDHTGFLALHFFNFSAAQMNALQIGEKLRCFGEVRVGYHGYEMAHPEYSKVTPNMPVEKFLTPVYPTTEGLYQSTLRNIIAQALNLLAQEKFSLNELLPAEISQRYHLPTLKEAIMFLHYVPPNTDLTLLSQQKHPQQQRLILEELLAHHLSLHQLRQQAQRHQAMPLLPKSKLINNFLSQLPFKLTNAQQRVVNEIQHDLANNYPTMRLIQGDVGCGKTIVAALAALTAIDNQQQVAIMAPTELLAEQHLRNFTRWLTPLNLKIAFLSGQTKGKIKTETINAIANGDVPLIIGTHALFQQGVEFARLALLIIDEQHRFGVHQRLALRQKGINNNLYPHQLIMTATPIPRTLAMTAYADLDHSIIDELPPNRMPIKTLLVANQRRNEVITRIKQACQKKVQAYWVCALIEESELLQCQAAENTAEQLRAALPELNIGLIHGRMKPAEKESIMHEFQLGKIDLLVATTVIEVGIDVPNASLMIIENPERFGLAQLHQLRGRIGRGNQESHCVLLYQMPLSALAQQRLTIMRNSSDGFVIAQKDLELRGPGEVLGTKQAGIIAMRIADILRDQYLFTQTQQIAEIILSKHPHLVSPIISRWLGNIESYKKA